MITRIWIWPKIYLRKYGEGVSVLLRQMNFTFAIGEMRRLMCIPEVISQVLFIWSHIQHPSLQNPPPPKYAYKCRYKCALTMNHASKNSFNLDTSLFITGARRNRKHEAMYSNVNDSYIFYVDTWSGSIALLVTINPIMYW